MGKKVTAAAQQKAAESLAEVMSSIDGVNALSTPAPVAHRTAIPSAPPVLLNHGAHWLRISLLSKASTIVP